MSITLQFYRTVILCTCWMSWQETVPWSSALPVPALSELHYCWEHLGFQLYHCTAKCRKTNVSGLSTNSNHKTGPFSFPPMLPAGEVETGMQWNSFLTNLGLKYSEVWTSLMLMWSSTWTFLCTAKITFTESAERHVQADPAKPSLLSLR